MTKSKSAIDAAELRQRAEQMAQWLIVHPLDGEVDAQRLVHELQVYQVELDLQNAELKHALAETDETLRRTTILNERLAQSMQESLTLREIADTAIQSKTDFLAHASEEVERQLKIIMAMSLRVRRLGVSAEQREFLDQMDAARQYVSDIVTAAVTSSRQDPAGPDLRRVK
jgi:hypothetical protein